MCYKSGQELLNEQNWYNCLGGYRLKKERTTKSAILAPKTAKIGFGNTLLGEGLDLGFGLGTVLGLPE
ncbi:MAG TPA: hypothetical protein VN207_03085, partial [Ktedonobacteraceae bacterium]|nr:hypothetical protein [Ktedonobacteraceae bacterium]